MSAGNAAGLAGAIAGGVIVVAAVALLVRLVVAVSRLGGATVELAQAVEDLRSATASRSGDMVDSEGDIEAKDGVEMNGRRRSSTRGRLELGLSGPAIKARALGKGTSEAARLWRERKER